MSSSYCRSFLAFSARQTPALAPMGRLGRLPAPRALQACGRRLLQTPHRRGRLVPFPLLPTASPALPPRPGGHPGTRPWLRAAAPDSHALPDRETCGARPPAWGSVAGRPPGPAASTTPQCPAPAVVGRDANGVLRAWLFQPLLAGSPAWRKPRPHGTSPAYAASAAARSPATVRSWLSRSPSFTSS